MSRTKTKPTATNAARATRFGSVCGIGPRLPADPAGGNAAEEGLFRVLIHSLR